MSSDFGKSRINRVIRLDELRVKKIAGEPFSRAGLKYDPALLLRRETNFLKMLASSKYFPDVLAYDDNSLIMTYAGEEIDAQNLPANWREQADAIIEELAKNSIIHRDIKQQNILVKAGTIQIIDFGWAIFELELGLPCPQDTTSQLPRDRIYDNRLALNWWLSKIESEKWKQ